MNSLKLRTNKPFQVLVSSHNSSFKTFNVNLQYQNLKIPIILMKHLTKFDILQYQFFFIIPVSHAHILNNEQKVKFHHWNRFYPTLISNIVEILPPTGVKVFFFSQLLLMITFSHCILVKYFTLHVNID